MKRFLLVAFSLAMLSSGAQKRQKVVFTRQDGGVDMVLNSSLVEFVNPTVTFSSAPTSWAVRINDQVYQFKNTDTVIVNSVSQLGNSPAVITSLLQNEVFNTGSAITPPGLPTYVAATGASNTSAIQTAITNNRFVEFGAGIHVINSPLTVPSNTFIRFAKGAVLKGGSAMTGELSTKATHLLLDGVSNVTIEGLTVIDPLSSFNNTFAFTSAIVLLNNSQNIKVVNSSITYSGVKELDGIFIRGSLSKNNLVENMQVNGGGITYCESGASYTTLTNCAVKNSKLNGYSGTGNGDTYDPAVGYSMGCRITNCRADSIGRMGLEEIHMVRGSVITGLTINSPGLNASYATVGFGISLVSREWSLSGFSVSNAKVYGVETFGNSGGVIENGTITWDSPLEIDRTGIVCNFTSNAEELQRTHGVRILNNNIYNATIGIDIVGDKNPEALIENNTVIDPVKHGLFSGIYSAKGIVNIINNRFEVRTPSLAGGYYERKLMFLYSDNVGVQANVERNTFIYQTTASGGGKTESAMNVGWDNARITGNTIIGNDVTGSGGAKVTGYHSSGFTSANLRFVNNVHSGCNNSFTSYVTPTFLYNTFNFGNATSLLAGLVTYHKLNESSGTPIDQTGGHNASLAPNVTQGTGGRYGTAYVFNGSTSRLEVPTVLQSGIFTISAWVKPSGSGDRTLISGNTTGTIDFRINSNGTLGLLKRSVTGIGNSTGGISSGVYSHVVVTYDAEGKYAFYINGVLSGTGTNLQTFTFATPDLVGSLIGGEHYTGEIDELCVWSRALGAGEVLALYNAPTYPFN